MFIHGVFWKVWRRRCVLLPVPKHSSRPWRKNCWQRGMAGNVIFFFRGQTQEFAKRWVRLTSLTIHPVVFLLGNLILQEGSWYSEKNPAPSWYRFIIMMQCLLYLSIGFHFKNQWCFNFFPTSSGGFTNHHLLDDPPLTKDLKACQDGESCGLVYSTPFHHVDAGCLEKPGFHTAKHVPTKTTGNAKTCRKSLRRFGSCWGWRFWSLHSDSAMQIWCREKCPESKLGIWKYLKWFFELNQPVIDVF